MSYTIYKSMEERANKTADVLEEIAQVMRENYSTGFAEFLIWDSHPNGNFERPARSWKELLVHVKTLKGVRHRFRIVRVCGEISYSAIQAAQEIIDDLGEDYAGSHEIIARALIDLIDNGEKS